MKCIHEKCCVLDFVLTVKFMKLIMINVLCCVRIYNTMLRSATFHVCCKPPKIKPLILHSYSEKRLFSSVIGGKNEPHCWKKYKKEYEEERSFTFVCNLLFRYHFFLIQYAGGQIMYCHSLSKTENDTPFSVVHSFYSAILT